MSNISTTMQSVKELFVSTLIKQLNNVHGNSAGIKDPSIKDLYILNPSHLFYYLEEKGFSLDEEGLQVFFSELEETLEGTTIDWSLCYPLGSQLSVFALTQDSENQEFFDGVCHYDFLLVDGKPASDENIDGVVTMTEEGINLLWESYVDYIKSDKESFALELWNALDLQFDSQVIPSSTIGEAPEESVEVDISLNSTINTEENCNMDSKTAARAMFDFFYPEDEYWYDKEGQLKPSLSRFTSAYFENKEEVLTAFERVGMHFPDEPAGIFLPANNKQRGKVITSIGASFAKPFFTNCNLYTGYFDVYKQKMVAVPISVLISKGEKVSTMGLTDEIEARSFNGFGDWYHSMVLSQLEAMTPAELCAMIRLSTSIARGRYRNVENNEGVIEICGVGSSFYVRFDFNNKVVLNNRGVERFANNKLYNNGMVLDSKVAMFVLAIDIISNAANQTNAKINGASSLWKRDDNYGAKMAKDDATKVVLDNLCLAMEYPTARSRKVFPFVGLQNGKQNPYDLSKFHKAGILAAPDKYNTTWITTGVGANAMKLGYYEDPVKGLCIASISDMSKVGKQLNRPPQGHKYLRADSPYREYSPFRILLGDGTFAKVGGIRKRTVWTNSRIVVDGSGVARINKDTTFVYYVVKTASRNVSSLRIPNEIRQMLEAQGDDVMKALRQEVMIAINKLVEEAHIFKPGEVILSLFDGKYDIVVNNSAAQDLRVTGGRIVDDLSVNSKYSDNFQVILETVMEAEDKEVKLRLDGIKATTLDAPVHGFSEDWDIMLNNEVTKGYPALVHMFVIAHGGGYYRTDGCVILDKTGEVVDLKQPINAFTKWCSNPSTYKTERIRISMARSVYEQLKKETDVFKGDDVQVVDKGYEDHVIVYETVKCIYGDLFYDVEVSTAREAVGTSSLTLEQVAAASIQHQGLAQQLVKEAEPRREAVHDLVKMMGSVFQKPEGVPSINLCVPSERQELIDLIGNVQNYDLNFHRSKSMMEQSKGMSRKQYIMASLGMTEEEMKDEANKTEVTRRLRLIGGYRSDRDIFKALDKEFPNGLIFSGYDFASKGKQDVSMYFRPKALMTLAAYSGGSGLGIVSDIIALLVYVTDKRNEKITRYGKTIFTMIDKISKGLNSWTNKMVDSAGVLKKVARAGNLVTCKVRTSFSPVLHSNDGIPIVGINPKCPLRFMLNVKEGDFIAINRTPMPFLTGCRVVFTTQAPMYHLLVDPITWAASNEGDSDGDGVGAFNLTPYSLVESDIHTMNTSLMGMEGYWYCYDKSEVPFAEFMSYEAKFGKKDFTALKATKKIDEDGIEVEVLPKPICTLVPVKEYTQGAANVATHYMFNVGIGYNICSALTFSTVELTYRNNADILPNPKALEYSLKAAVISWRLVYEGLGLSGFSKTAKEFFEALFDGVIALNSKDGKIYKTSAQKNDQYLSNCEFFGLHKDFSHVELENAYYEMLEEAKGDSDFTAEVEEAYEQLSKSMGGVKRIYTKNAGSDDVLVDYMATMKACMTKGVQSDEEVVAILQRLINARNVTYTYGKIERGRKVEAGVTRNNAALYGSLRRIGQGDDPVEVTIPENLPVGFSSIEPTSLFIIVKENELYNGLTCGFLKAYLKFGATMYTDLINKKMAVKQAEELANAGVRPFN